MTAQTAETQVVQFAQSRLVQARANDAVLNPVPAAGTVLGDLLGKISQSARRRMFPGEGFLVALERMKSTPQLLDQLHAVHCFGGTITVENAQGEHVDARCPRCAAIARESRLRSQMLASGVEGRYLDVEWSDLELHAPLDRVAASSRNIARLIEHGVSLVLYSEQTGSGKTQAAMLIAKTAIRAGYSAHVVNLGRLALDVRESYRNSTGDAVTEKAALQRLIRPDMLIIDDLGAGESDAASVERRLLHLALDDRQNHRRPTIITTNLLLAPPAGEQRRDPKRPLTLVEVLGSRGLGRIQPMTPIHIDHGINFRTRKSDVSW